VGKAGGVTRKAPKGSKLQALDERINRIFAMVRAKVEHPFCITKRHFGPRKTHDLKLAKIRAQLFTLFALGNLFLVWKCSWHEEEHARNQLHRGKQGAKTEEFERFAPIGQCRDPQAAIPATPKPLITHSAASAASSPTAVTNPWQPALDRTNIDLPSHRDCPSSLDLADDVG